MADPPGRLPVWSVESSCGPRVSGQMRGGKVEEVAAALRWPNLYCHKGPAIKKLIQLAFSIVLFF